MQKIRIHFVHTAHGIGDHFETEYQLGSFCIPEFCKVAGISYGEGDSPPGGRGGAQWTAGRQPFSVPGPLPLIYKTMLNNVHVDITPAALPPPLLCAHPPPSAPYQGLS